MGRLIRWEDLREGALGGATGTAAFTGLMYGAQRVGLLGEMPPRKITRKIMERTAKTTRYVDAATTIAHLSFGLASGVLFAAITHRVRTKVPRVVLGMGFGAAVWAASYAGWAPALGLMPAPSKDRPDRPIVGFLGHLLFGALLSAFVTPLGRGGRGARR